MSDGQEIGNDKSLYLSNPKRTGVVHQSGLANLKTATRVKKLFTLHNNRKVEAEHITIPAADVQTQTAVHPMNPRNQEALSVNAVRDILLQIEARGIDTEGVAVKRAGKYLLIEGSRRRFCCIKASKDLPLWVLPDELTPEDIQSIISAAQTSRRFSYREIGFQYIQKMKEMNFTKNEELANYLGTSHVSVSKRIQAAQISDSLITLFPDYEAIPNAFYNQLARFQKYVERNLFSLDDVVEQVKSETNDLPTDDIADTQKKVLKSIIKAVEQLDENRPKKGWETRELVTFENKDKYARISKSASGRKVKFEFNRMSNDLIKEIEAFIADKLKND
ncbi:ParB family chromosome partitioning protein [Buttiauxella sp. BIGb0552]|uniref:ParB family protein n=1 Tax=Buttiauxella sp. BIGb0552 TaxID=2485120 RepID=UPI00106714EB|nr:ParB family protein [Buttiauxella sp. BIGb0552]TDX12079.1 ParB family chromosome partitioning protein [Buttiauxella sp. BIGb0552]